ncbi:hypothetical protein P7K49_025428 [Saguinus oedipus]|uniref:Uncharacterized protein n=1 Tax=Saguinus oedipus TaxID=9490 RepID=A0ABQ9UH38_SAGOE|nr:hypothetical protein P7K49_025428 [Saguinus oedipus]
MPPAEPWPLALGGDSSDSMRKPQVGRWAPTSTTATSRRCHSNLQAAPQQPPGSATATSRQRHSNLQAAPTPAYRGRRALSTCLPIQGVNYTVARHTDQGGPGLQQLEEEPTVTAPG